MLATARACGLALAAGLLPFAPSAVAESAPASFVNGQDLPIWLVTLWEPGYTNHQGPAAAERHLEAAPPAAVGPLSRSDMEQARRDYLAWLDSRRARFLDSASADLGRTLAPRVVLTRYRHALSLALTEPEATALRQREDILSIRRAENFVLQGYAGKGEIGSGVLGLGSYYLPGETGRGAVIGVIDTLINPFMPQLYPYDAFDEEVLTNPRGRYYGQCAGNPSLCNVGGKVIGLYDFGQGLPDNQKAYNHGTMVASIAAGTYKEIWLSDSAPWPDLQTWGVAPGASLISYGACIGGDVWDQPGHCPEDLVLAALEQAAIDEVDVILFAAGGPIRDPWTDLLGPEPNIAGVMLRLIEEEDIVVVVAAGNTGPAEGTTTYPANAPWVISAGGFDRGIRLHSGFILEATEFSSPAFRGHSFTGRYPPLDGSSPAVVRAANYGFSGCAIGQPSVVERCGFSVPSAGNPFASGTFDGEIVICENHGHNPWQLSENLRRAGAGAMVLVNRTQDQDEGLQYREYCIPTTLLDSKQHTRLIADFERVRAENGIVYGAIEATSSRSLQSHQHGRWAPTSARGPDRFTPGVQIPRVVAPGNHVLAASTHDGGPHFADVTHNSSVAAGFVAGAAAVLRAMNPDWSARRVTSALTMRHRLDLTHARERSLLLPVDFRFDDPERLNLSTRVDEDCFDTCTVTWTLQATRAGTWTVVGGDYLATVTPRSFSLAAGQSVDLTLTVEAPAFIVDDLASWGGRTVYLRGPDDLTELSLEYYASAVSGRPVFRFGNAANRDRREVTVRVSDMLEHPRFSISDVASASRLNANLPPLGPVQGSDPFSLNEPGSRTFWLTVPPGTEGLWVEVDEASVAHGRVLVGHDRTASGKIRQADMHCITANPLDRNFCLVESPEPGSWWVVLQNHAGSLTRIVSADAYVFGPNRGESFVHGPAQADGGPVSLKLGWDGTAHPPGKVGMLISMRDPVNSSDHTRVFARIPVFAVIPAPAADAQVVLIPGETSRIHVGAGMNRTGVYVDVPPTATAMRVTVSGGPAQAALRHLPLGAIAGFEPATPPMPATTPAASGSGENIVLDLVGQAIKPGRWYLELSTGQTARTLDVTVSLTESGRIEPWMHIWNPASRTTNQGISWQRRGPGFIHWYSYEENGDPVFYMAIGDVNPASSVWVADLIRVAATDWDQYATRVGTAILTSLSETDLMFSWRLKGAHGSERMAPIGPRTCPTINGQMLNLTGTWYFNQIGKSDGGGNTAVFTDTVQAQIHYFFDHDGEPRWVIAAGDDIGPAQTTIPVQTFMGSCPYCTFVTPTRQTTGFLNNWIQSETEMDQYWRYTLPFNGQTMDRTLIAQRFSEPGICE